jgi:hypothetical protein
MHFFVCAGSREVWATLATHCRLPDTHVCCENWVSRPGRLVLFLLPVCPCLQEGALRRIQGPLTTFLFHSGISGSERAAASRHTHTHTHTHTHLSRSAAPHSRLQVLEMNEWASEWTWITIPWLYNLCHFPSCCTWKHFFFYSCGYNYIMQAFCLTCMNRGWRHIYFTQILLVFLKCRSYYMYAYQLVDIK